RRRPPGELRPHHRRARRLLRLRRRDLGAALHRVAMSFSFHRGAPALDFVGTVGGRASEAPEERLPHPEALGRWLAQAGLVRGARPTESDLAAARAVREAIFRLGAALVAGRSQDREARATLNAAAEMLRLGAPRLEADGSAAWVAERPIAFALARLAA